MCVRIACLPVRITKSENENAERRGQVILPRSLAGFPPLVSGKPQKAWRLSFFITCYVTALKKLKSLTAKQDHSVGVVCTIAVITEILIDHV